LNPKEDPIAGFVPPDTSIIGIHNKTMADRDILPGNFKPSHYDLALTELEFDNWTYQGNVK
jgi:hypothetical protein